MSKVETELRRLEPKIAKNDLNVKQCSEHDNYIEIYSICGFEDTIHYTGLSGWLQGYWIGTGGSSLSY